MNSSPILYSIDCPKCKVLKQKLQNAQIAFVLCSDLKKIMELGIEYLPALYADGKMMDFAEAIEWVNEHSKEE